MAPRPLARTGLMLAGVALSVGAAGCAVPSFGAPESASEQGDGLRSLWQWGVVAALVVGAVVWSLIIWAILRYRQRGETLPTQVAENVPIEIVLAVIPILIVAVLFVIGNRVQNDAAAPVARPDVTVEVIGFQWSWQFRYRGENVTVTGAGEGTRGPELVLPRGRTTRLVLVSRDVNHSFWVPRFLSKRDLIQGVDNSVDVTPTETGDFDGRCAEFCGLDHWRMNFRVRIVSPTEFEAWLADQEAAG